MLKQILLNIVISALLVATGLACYHFLCVPKIAFVKTAPLLEQYKAMKLVNTVFQNELQMTRTNLDTLHKRYLSVKNNIALKKKSPEKWGYELAGKESDFTKYQKQGDEQLQKRRAELNAIVIQKINKFVEEYGKKNNYRIILGANGNGSIMYGMEADDITDKIMTELNQNYLASDTTQFVGSQP